MTDELSHSRIIILGASNVSRGISTVVETARLLTASPVELLIAMGHGRSYGMKSRVMGRTLPGILECGIWDRIHNDARTGHLSDQSSSALITDIGNDIMYGVSPEELVNWVRECYERLCRANVQITMTLPPIRSILKMTPWQYRLVKSIVFPSCRLRFSDAVDRVKELHSRLVDFSTDQNIPSIEPYEKWYGMDPIHIRSNQIPIAWREMLNTCLQTDDSSIPLARRSLRRWMRLRVMTPEQWWFAGIRLGRKQPSYVMNDGTTISLY